MSNPAAQLRSHLISGGFVLAPFVFDALQAKIAERAGFSAVYMSGFGTAASYGYPDVGLLTMTEMVHNATRIARAVSVPVIADADTGYGDAINVARTVREYEQAGVAAIHIEDQLWPKKCGFFEGKQIIDSGEAAAKIRAAVDTRVNPDFVIIARTDALAVGGWDEVESRSRLFADAGADLIFVDGIRTRDDLFEYVRRIGDLRLLYNGGLLPASEIEEMGFSVMIAAGTIMAAYQGYVEAVTSLKETGQLELAAMGEAFAGMIDLLGLRQVYELERRHQVDTSSETPGLSRQGAR